MNVDIYMYIYNTYIKYYVNPLKNQNKFYFVTDGVLIYDARPSVVHCPLAPSF
jgi:hypothetical protein